jgi:hypothetical protein
MTSETIVQIACWVAVSALMVVHVLVERGRLSRGGAALRLAGGAAAGCIIAAAVVTRFWPIAALGLLWLRTEVFAHRHGPVAESQHRWAAFAHAAGRLVQPALKILLRIEIVVVVTVVLVLLGQWAARNGTTFNGKSDRVLCGLLRGKC